MINRRSLLAGLAALLALPAVAAPPIDHIAIAKAVIEGFLLPKTQEFAAAAIAQHMAWQEACSTMDQSRLDGLQGQFSVVAEAYATIEVIRFGPLSENSRAERMVHWPERKNAIAKGMTDVLKSGQVVDAARLEQASAAAQGLSALERLVFEPDFTRRLSDVDGPPIPSLKDVDRATLCSYGTAIAARIAAEASRIAEAWADPSSSIRAPLATGDGAKAMLARVTTDLLSALELIKDKKIKAALGPAAGEEKSGLLEMWRSGRSLHQIAANLASINALVALLVPDGAYVTADGMTSALRQIEPLKGCPPRDLPATERSKLLLIINLIGTVQTDLADRLPATLDVTAGFNSNDGD
jgi:uncharacterized protein